MKNSKVLFQELTARISLTDQEEIQSIVYLILEHVFSLTKTDVIAEKDVPVKGHQLSQLQEIVDRINRHEPVQYVLGEAQFFGRRFFVNRSVLIPRPETEELVALVINHLSQKAIAQPAILDIGTGSGCIPVTLYSEIPAAKVYATDISADALDVAKANAGNLNAQVTFLKHNILAEQLPFTSLDIIVSNPPYITEKEIANMHPNVVKYEPHVALFVPDNDPLKFYRSIAAKAFTALKSGGLLAVEINEAFGQETAELFKAEGFSDVKIVADLSGKDRVVTATKTEKSS